MLGGIKILTASKMIPLIFDFEIVIPDSATCHWMCKLAT